MRAALRAMPTLLRVGIAEAVAYRAEFIVWMLTTTLPLVMLGLWTSVAAEGPFRGYSAPDFVAYYLAALIVRNLTGSWVVWQLNDEIRRGVLSMRLLRPVHPFLALGASHLAAVPLRGLVCFPIALVLLFTSGRESVTGDPVLLLLLVPSLAAAWLITYSMLFAIGCLAFFIEKSMSVVEVYFGVFAVFSGYLVPLELLPSWAQGIAAWSPFRFLLSVPIEIMLGAALSRGHALALLGGQLAWSAAMLALALALWRAGVKRFEAVGG